MAEEDAMIIDKSEQATLPSDFLRTPGPEVEVTRIDFAQMGLPEYSGLYAIILDNVLTPAECSLLTTCTEARTSGVWEPALVNVGGGRQELLTSTRKSGRIIWDDRALAERIWGRVQEYVEDIEYLSGVHCADILGNGPVKRGETWRMTRLNERLRFLKYGPGEYFQPHCDGQYITDDKREKSFFTLHLYLNEADEGNDLKGGSTEFHSMTMHKSLKVDPKVGRVLIFQHAYLLHSGEKVTSGTKITMRTDIMYGKA